MSDPDHIIISINNTFITTSFSISGARLSLTSSFPIILGSWHSLHVQRYHSHAVLLLDDHQPVRGEAVSSITSLNLDQTSYIAQSPHLSTPGLQGCIRDLSINKRHVDLTSGSHVVSSYRVSDCSQHTCRDNPCHHGGECISVWPPDTGRHVCHCDQGFTGDTCQHTRGHCHPNPCHNGGECHYDRRRGVRCQCRHGYHGKLCHHHQHSQKHF